MSVTRVALTPQTPPGAFSETGGALVFTPMNIYADASGGNKFASSGKDLVVVLNSGDGAESVTVESVGDVEGRIGDATASIAAGDTVMFGPLGQDGWMQNDHNIYIDPAGADLEAAVIKLP